MSDPQVQLVPEKTEAYLTEKQYLDYEAYRRKFVEWLLVFGKNPKTAEGYAEDTVVRTAYRCGSFDRWVWQEEGRYTMPVTQEHADAFLRHIALEDYSGSHKANTKDALLRYFKWRHHEFDEKEWEPEICFSKDTNVQPPDYLTQDERRKIRQAALNYGSIPTYDSLTPEERSRWKKHVSQALRKPEREVVPADWKEVNGWKFTSMVWTSLDAGLRPAEVGRARVSWVDVSNKVLRIPVKDSTKNHDNWEVSITERTAEALGRWIEQRKANDLYDDTDTLWLTREGNPYGPNSLRRLLHRLCEIAEIDTEHRKMSWYSIRHSVGTHMTREEDLAATKAQLRHRSVQTTMRYDAAPAGDRRDALDRMG